MLLLRNLSKKEILVSNICISLKITNDRTNEIWSKNLNLAELTIFKSEKIPRIKIKNVNRIKDKMFWFKKYKIPKNKKIPPVNGILKSEANFWWLSPVTLTNKKFFLRKILIRVNRTDNINKYPVKIILTL